MTHATVVPHHTSKLWSGPTASSARSRRRGYEGGAHAAMIVQLIGETIDYPAFVHFADAIICFRRARDGKPSFRTQSEDKIVNLLHVG